MHAPYTPMPDSETRPTPTMVDPIPTMVDRIKSIHKAFLAIPDPDSADDFQHKPADGSPPMPVEKPPTWPDEPVTAERWAAVCSVVETRGAQRAANVAVMTTW
jgi:hypothetical protein